MFRQSVESLTLQIVQTFLGTLGIVGAFRQVAAVVQPGMMPIDSERYRPMILREREGRPVMRVGLLVTWVFLACLDRLHSRLECTIGLSQIVEQSGEVAVTARAKPSGEVFSASRNAREMGGQRLPWVSEKWS